MKVEGKYKVTFNYEFAQIAVGAGEEGESTIDYVGDDVDELVKEVTAGDPNFPMVFKKVSELASQDDVEEGMVGFFISEDDLEDGDETPTAIMFEE